MQTAFRITGAAILSRRFRGAAHSTQEALTNHNLVLTRLDLEI
jgi:hypothetical protein